MNSWHSVYRWIGWLPSKRWRKSLASQARAISCLTTPGTAWRRRKTFICKTLACPSRCTGHGSSSVNSASESAYNCGACVDSRGGLYARSFTQLTRSLIGNGI
ncbi:MAG: DUF2309 family protein [Pirellulaceae bacterium]|nr:DUF2309 family protein [Pirellulaceae bacterium]